MEIWKKINGLDGYYISDHGRVKGDQVTVKWGRQFKTYPERFLNPWYSKTGYNYIDISINGKRHRFLLHRLVGKYFIPNPKNRPQINHKYANKSNNHYLNLEWCTAKENLEHARDLGLNNSIGTNNKMAKFTSEQVKAIRLSKETVTKIVKIYNATLSVISRIRSLKAYKNV